MEIITASYNGTTNYTTVEATGGEEKHKLTVAELPSHTHTYNSGRWAWAERSGGGDIINSQSETSYRFSRTSGSTGDGGAHENRQPYITVYMWKRTA